MPRKPKIMHKISILMPVYNGEAYLAAAVKSVLRQTFSDWELLIIDDGSTDKSQLIANNLAEGDSRIKTIFQKENKGLIYTLNHGLSAATGDFIARLDCDDEWSNSEKLSRQMNVLLEHPEVGLVGTWALMVDENGLPKRELRYPASDQQIRREILAHNCFVHSSIMARTGLLRECGSYNPAETYVEDYGLWMRIGLKARVCNIPENMVNYRINPVGVTRKRNKAQVAAAAKLITQFKNKYPNYRLARVKWALQTILMSF